MAYTRIKATGIGAFPIDMLRFLQAWPATSDDAAAIFNSAQRSVIGNDKRESILLETARGPIPHHILRRFESFGWQAVADDSANAQWLEAREQANPHPGALEDVRRFAAGFGDDLERAVQHRAETRSPADVRARAGGWPFPTARGD